MTESVSVLGYSFVFNLQLLDNVENYHLALVLLKSFVFFASPILLRLARPSSTSTPTSWPRRTARRSDPHFLNIDIVTKTNVRLIWI
jgi:hypothetical protein